MSRERALAGGQRQGGSCREGDRPDRQDERSHQDHGHQRTVGPARGGGAVARRHEAQVLLPPAVQGMGQRAEDLRHGLRVVRLGMVIFLLSLLWFFFFFFFKVVVVVVFFFFAL